MSVCVLILAYNGGRDAIEAVESLIPEWHLVDSVLVTDNGATDDTREVLRREQGRLSYTFLPSDENRGFAGGFNHLFEEALRRSRAEWFLALNNDTVAERGMLKGLLAAAGPERVVSPMILWHKDRRTVIQCAGTFDRDMMKMDNAFAGRLRGEVPPGVHEVELTDGCCFLIHRRWLERGFRFDPRLFIYFEDTDLFLRLRKAGARFFYAADSVLLHKEYGSSGGRDRPSAFRNYYYHRNRLALVRRVVPLLRRPRVYRTLLGLARDQYREQKPDHPEAARAIALGVRDFFLCRMGRRYQP